MKANIVRRKYLVTLLIVALLLSVASFTIFQARPGNVRASASLIQQVSHDTFTNNTSQHQTQVEPDTLSFGPIVVSAFQSGRFVSGGGSSGISWATSFDAGLTWKTGNLPDITVYNGGTY